MMRVKGWYIGLLIVWSIFALPGFILGVVWAGGDLRSMVPIGAEFHPLDIAIWLVGVALILSPLWLAPFGILAKHRPPEKPE